jgi:hypothetical protein
MDDRLPSARLFGSGGALRWGLDATTSRLTLLDAACSLKRARARGETRRVVLLDTPRATYACERGQDAGGHVDVVRLVPSAT